MEESQLDINLEIEIDKLKKEKDLIDREIEPLKKRINPTAEEEYKKFNSQFMTVMDKKKEINSNY